VNRLTVWLSALHQLSANEECREVQDDGERDLGSCGGVGGAKVRVRGGSGEDIVSIKPWFRKKWESASLAPPMKRVLHSLVDRGLFPGIHLYHSTPG